jgi:hypothetical protein
MRYVLLALFLSAANIFAGTEATPALSSVIPKEIEAIYPRDGKNTVIVRVEQDSDIYVLLQNSDGEVGAWLLYRFTARTQKAELLKASETLFPFDAGDVRTPPKQIQAALATAVAQHMVATYPGGVSKMSDYWQQNADGWRNLPHELQDAFKAAGINVPAS